ncbi:glycosyltransferase [Terriglobus roseus]|uniref:Glycosyltransferase, catalytic subunit of cellulose synthase and poly-beta-1,6-N-acetylglucosamine synthase n=1 Tax=Terriglobus roseus TaxID=392734 RepID=A0A1H4PNT3_9BACT|nr:glycosyltransferase family 2 protein [Terriglobus roseus]SEC09077.1 Glycosyltransferase, catalytic subunit of cellulose synthase and poly-beta-1,6-N-acetylglucosamine synthase [Terriglobus roseus]
MLVAWTIASAVCAAIPAVMTVVNLREYREPSAITSDGLPAVTVIIPARNEAGGIAACVGGVLASSKVDLQLLVVDDASTDDTAEIVRGMAAQDARLKLIASVALPAGWNGKQHACWQGAQAANTPLLCFLDADVRLHPDALARTVTQMVRERAALLSGFPRQITRTWLEKLLIPLIHFVLLGLLPMRGLRCTTKPAYAAGCGQFLLVDREAYNRSGGHAAIRHTMHDGLLLPRLLRSNGYTTRLADLTHLAECRMYTTAAATWNGLSKNATEGIAAPARIVPMTLLLGLGQVLPLPLLWLAWERTTFIIPFLGPPIRIGMAPVWWSVVALLLSYLPRVVNAVRYRQSWLGALLHPVGVALLLVLQWVALARKLLGRPATWKSRAYPSN